MISSTTSNSRIEKLHGWYVWNLSNTWIIPEGDVLLIGGRRNSFTIHICT